MADQARLNLLFEKYVRRECTHKEVEELVLMLKEINSEEALGPQMLELWEKVKHEEKEHPVDWPRIYEQITYKTKSTTTTKRSLKWIDWVAAASIAALLIFFAGLYLWKNNVVEKPGHLMVKQDQNDVLPGGNKAILTLANGTQIILDSVHNGQLISQGNSKAVKMNSGLLAYHAKDQIRQPADKSRPVTFNTLTTPNGGQYQLVLPDGTKVWLNAASSIRYPTAFTGKERIVEITGEAYFEVAPLSQPLSPKERGGPVPFIVKKGDVEIKVLGTHFNVNAYENEAVMKITLLEGLVRVSQTTHNTQRTTDNTQQITDNTQQITHNSQIIKPGQQVQLNKNGEMKLVKKADIEKVIAWKNGLFVFHNDDLATIMRRLERWYDVEVEYRENKRTSSHFTGAVRRQVNLSEVLKMLELTGGAHFEIKERTIVVNPQPLKGSN